MNGRRRLAGAIAFGAVAITCSVVLTGCGSGGVDSGGFSAADRNAAQTAMNSLQTSNIPTQLINLSATAGLPPAACQVHLVSTKPHTFSVYVFWIPYVGPQSYSWLNMVITKDASKDKFHLGTEEAVLPGGQQLPGGEMIAPELADFDTPLAKYGPEQDKKNQRVLKTHAGDVFEKPTSKCEVLNNGYLRLLPNAT